MKKNLKKYIPRKLKISIKKLLYAGSKFKCNVCKSNVRLFYLGGSDAGILKDLGVVGGGKYTNDVCPICRSSYRQRLVNLYLDSENFFAKGKKVLHFAPEINIALKLQKTLKENYIPCDLNPKRYNHIKNVQEMNTLNILFDDASFDHVICNHVLEHIQDDKKAMSEIFRVLKPGGWALLQVPVSYKINTTIENPDIVLPEERLKHFGQKDHVRIYEPANYIERLTNVGFKVKTYSAKDFQKMNIKNFDKLALHPKEVLFIAFKEKN